MVVVEVVECEIVVILVSLVVVVNGVVAVGLSP